MRKVILGIIAEYNPFHNGHAYHIAKARAACGADLVIAVMSGPFTQRGDAAILSPVARAEMAVLSGVDLVFELPALFAVREADAFALGGVSLLTALGCTHISFGCETVDLALLQNAAELIMNPTPTFSSYLHSALEKGCSYAKAQGTALEKWLHTKALSLPNNVLGLCYMQAISRLQSPLIPIPVARLGDYHDVSLPKQNALPSATALRAALLAGNWQAVRVMMPESTYPILQREALAGRIQQPNALDKALRLTLINADENTLNALPGASEGLDKLIIKQRDTFVTRETLVAALKSKRYTYTRLNRMLTHLLLNISCESFLPAPPYARLLAAKKASLPYLRNIKKSGLQIIEKAARYDKSNPCFISDIRAYDLWALGANLPFGLGFRQSPAIQDLPFHS